MRNIDKLVHLLNVLEVPAYDLVENYSVALDVLKVDYGQDGLIQSTLREQLWQLPVVKLRQLVTNLSGHGEHFTMM